MEEEITEEELNEISSQLSCPNGEKGIQLAETMNDTNIGMTLASIKALNIKSRNTILELGHGNCAHLSKILARWENIQYYGLEISETMQQEAIRKNSELRVQHKIKFKLYDGTKIPFKDNLFDRIMTVNTIYFWSSPIELLKEIYRVLKDKGIFVLTFAQKEFMQQLPFVKQEFKLFDNQDIIHLVEKTDFKLADIVNQTEQVKSKSGELTDRNFSIITLEKNKVFPGSRT